jgi:hypothetical protein
MPAHRTPRWSAAEVRILSDVYVREGLEAVIPLLPHRSWHSIYVKASKLGLKCEKLPNAPKCRLAGEHLEEAVRLRVEGWSFARIGARFGLSESAACNAVLNEQCVRSGHTPAERHQNGRLTERGMERLRWCLKKGMKGVEIQLRLGVTASCIAEQRRRYNRELKENGKALLPPAGAGAAYSGLKLSREKKREVEAQFLEGFGTAKVAATSGVSKTSCTRIRNCLIRKLKRDGMALPGCDLTGARRTMKDHVRHVPDELRQKARGLILDRIPVRRAAAICGIGACTVYRIRDELRAELGDAMPKPRLPGRVSKLRAEMLYAKAIPAEHLWRFRELVRQHGEHDARTLLRAEISAARRNLSFDEQLERVAAGTLAIGPALKLALADPEMTLGGVATGQLG